MYYSGNIYRVKILEMYDKQISDFFVKDEGYIEILKKIKSNRYMLI